MNLKSRYDLLLDRPGKIIKEELRLQVAVDRKLNYSKDIVDRLIKQIKEKLQEEAVTPGEVEINFKDGGEKVIVEGTFHPFQGEGHTSGNFYNK